MQLTKKEEKYLRKLRDKHILADIVSEKINGQNGVMLVTCSDGDQIDDIFGHVKKIIKKPRIHTFALNGGGLLIDEKSPLSQELREDRVLLRHITVAENMKQIKTVKVYAHAPCGAARAQSLTIKQEMDLLIDGVMHLEDILGSDFQIIAQFHINWRNGLKRSYFLDIEKWLRYHKKIK